MGQFDKKLSPHKLAYNSPVLIVVTILLGVLTIVMAVYGGYLTSSDPHHQRWFIGLGMLGTMLVLAQGYFLYRDDKEKTHATEGLQASIRNLESQTTALMNATRLQATLDDFKHLEAVILDKKRPISPVHPESQTLPPAIVEHVRIIQRRAASDKSEAPFGLQVIMQTDVSIQPVAFRVVFDHEISDGNAFIVGEGAYTSMATGFSNDRKAFVFSWHSPAFTPSSSLVVSVQSKFDLRVAKIEKIQPLF